MTTSDLGSLRDGKVFVNPTGLLRAATLATIGLVGAPEDPYPEIGNMLAGDARAGGPWRRVVLDAQVGPDWGRFEALAFEGHGKWRGVRVEHASRLLALLQRVREATAAIKDAGTLDWTTIRFTRHGDGAFDVDFGYEPLP